VECLTEFTCSVFVDGELPDLEFRQVEKHIETCEACRAMSAAFREESRLLVACIQEIDFMESVEATSPERSERAVGPVARPIDVAKFGGILVGLSAFIKLAMSSPENIVLPSIPVNLDWLDPSNLYGRLNWLLSTIAFIAAEGISKMTSLIDSLSFVALFVLILAGAFMVVRRSIGKSAIVAALGTILLIVGSSSSSYAMDVRNAGQNNVMTLPMDQIVDDNLFATGESVIINGTVTGDLFAFARSVTINGTVKGNVITGASNIEVPGIVEGSILAGGQNIQVSGKVTHNVVGFGQSFIIGKEATVGGDAAGFGNAIHMAGSLAHNFYAFGLADISGTVGRNVTFHGATISVLPSARIGGDLRSYVQKAETVHVDSSATIGGKQTIELPQPGPSQYSTFKFYFAEILRAAAAFVTGILLMLLFPRLRNAGFSDVVSILKSGGIGFLFIFATPIAAIIVAVTLIGLPVALVGLVAWCLGLYLAKIIIANFIGRTLLTSQGDRMSSVALGLLVGLALVFIAINLPFIGGLIHFVLVLIGFGALIMTVYGSFQAEHDSGR
jgi:anti-sigma factor RsiW/cytoskeletal protein CcmA (bactofilin family)